uniref:SnoaL-like domain-containing protein n=1 Tax=Hemiselmis andersenii TaxID=464988 RepID=A0A6T8H729_HEMAN
MAKVWILLLLASSCEISRTSAFAGGPFLHLNAKSRTFQLRGSQRGQEDGGGKGDKLEYRDPLTKVLANFLPGGKPGKSRDKSSAMDAIDWNKPKSSGLSVDQMAARVDQGLRERAWFVTGEALPELFHPDFEFKDPNVKTKGIEEYARGVHRLFNQEASSMQVVECAVSSEKIIGVKWRLEGAVNVGPGLEIKPYVVYTDLEVGQDGLIIAQEDRFSIPAWELLIWAFLPFLRPMLPPPCPPIE